MKPIEIVNFNHNNFLYIGYILTTTCNYHCSYCATDLHDGKYRFPDFDITVKNLRHLINVYKLLGKTEITIRLLGGEPTLWPKLGEFSKFLSEEMGCRVVMSTNGSRTLRWWEEYYRYFDDIHLSVHGEYCDVNHVKSVLDLIYDNGNSDTFTGAQVVMDPKHWDKCLTILNNLVEHPTPWLVKTMMLNDPVTDKVMSEYTEEQISFMRNTVKKRPPFEYVERMKSKGKIVEDDQKESKIIFDNGTEEPYNTFRLMENGWNSFYNWHCNVGVDRIGILANGTIMGVCGQKLFNIDDCLSINDLNFQEKFTSNIIVPTVCKQLMCPSSSDIRVTKRKQNV